MPEITEYDYYDATLAITIVTQRPEAAPSQLLVSATLHEEFAARVRKVLREFRQPLDVYLPYYAVNRIRPSGTARDIDRELNQDLLRQQFALGFSLTAAAQIADEIAVFAMERNIEKAVRDLFTANELPHIFIPGQDGVHGESYIDIVVTLGAATNQGVWNVPAGIA